MLYAEFQKKFLMNGDLLESAQERKVEKYGVTEFKSPDCRLVDKLVINIQDDGILLTNIDSRQVNVQVIDSRQNSVGRTYTSDRSNSRGRHDQFYSSPTLSPF